MFFKKAKCFIRQCSQPYIDTSLYFFATIASLCNNIMISKTKI